MANKKKLPFFEDREKKISQKKLATKLEGVGKAIVAGPLKKNLFYSFPYQIFLCMLTCTGRMLLYSPFFHSAAVPVNHFVRMPVTFVWSTLALQKKKSVYKILYKITLL